MTQNLFAFTTPYNIHIYNNVKMNIRNSECLKGLEADSWGTEFIFVLPSTGNYEIAETACYLFGMDREISITVHADYGVIQYTRDNKPKLREIKQQLTFKGFHKYEIESWKMDEIKEGLHMLLNTRIHITATDKISINCYVSDVTGAVDYFLVHPVGMGGNYYSFSIPTHITATVYFLPLGATNQTIWQEHGVHDVSITIGENNQLKAGSLWQYTTATQKPISLWIRDQLEEFVSKPKLRNSLDQMNVTRLLIVVSVRGMHSREGVDADIAHYMPTTMIVDRCAELRIPAHYPVAKSFSNDVLMTAPSPFCPQETIEIKTSLTESDSLLMKWDETSSIISLHGKISKDTFIISSQTTIMNIVHCGGENGFFLHEVPPYSQWVNGDSAVVIPPDHKATLYVLADDYGREATLEGHEYPYFETLEDIVSDFSLFLYKGTLISGAYRIGIDQELGGRYIAIVIGESDRSSIAYVAAINLNLTTREPTTTPLLASTMTTVTTTQTASLDVISNNLFAICVCLIVVFGGTQ
uniref:IgGFc-binding protein N-terminal domain-containing protein n=1 Tax=Setaria digitata TaxID=48799 RepID=A0A915PLI8_9BILA